MKRFSNIVQFEKSEIKFGVDDEMKEKNETITMREKKGIVDKARGIVMKSQLSWDWKSRGLKRVVKHKA